MRVPACQRARLLRLADFELTSGCLPYSFHQPWHGRVADILVVFWMKLQGAGISTSSLTAMKTMMSPTCRAEALLQSMRSSHLPGAVVLQAVMPSCGDGQWVCSCVSFGVGAICTCAKGAAPVAQPALSFRHGVGMRVAHAACGRADGAKSG